jgi:hypothetical protein
MFRLGFETRGKNWAHLSDAFNAVGTSNIDSYLRQIDADHISWAEAMRLFCYVSLQGLFDAGCGRPRCGHRLR